LLLTFSRKLDTINFVKKVRNYYLNLLLKNENVWSEVSHPRIKAKKRKEARLMNLGKRTKCDEIQSNDFINLATTKAAAKLKLKFNKLAS
jgi:hypothetical protein